LRRIKKFNNPLPKFDYTSISCHFSIPIKLPEVICINIIIYDHNNNNSITTTLKNVPLEKIIELIEYNRQLYKESILPLSLSKNSNATTTDNLIRIEDDDPILT
jgi:hypothetical protein